MSTMYFIGGAPRSGKSTAVAELLKQKPVLAASTDAIRASIKSVTTPEANPRLFKTLRGAFGSPQHFKLLQNDPEKVLEYELAEATETWKSVVDFLSYYRQDGRDAAIEGVAVLPSKLAELDYDYKAVFIVNLSDQTDIILDYAATHSSDWLHKYDEETVRLYAKFLHRWNRFYADEAVKLGIPVVEIAKNNFRDSIQKSIKILLT